MEVMEHRVADPALRSEDGSGEGEDEDGNGQAPRRGPPQKGVISAASATCICIMSFSSWGRPTALLKVGARSGEATASRYADTRSGWSSFEHIVTGRRVVP